MSIKKHFGIFLVCLGALTGALTVTISQFSRGQSGVYLVMLGIAIGCVIFGSILVFTRILDRFTRPIVDEIYEDVKDDIEDIKKRRITNAQAFVVITGILSLIFLTYVLKLQKFAATWGGLPVAIPTLIVLGILLVVVTRTEWFREQTLNTPFGIFFIPVIGFIVSLFLGLNITEDARNLSWNVGENVLFNQNIPTGFNFMAGTGDVFSLPSCNDDVCGVITLVIALFVITFVMVVGSAYIPHFWFLSGFVLLTIMALITIHEIRVRPENPRPEKRMYAHTEIPTLMDEFREREDID